MIEEKKPTLLQFAINEGDVYKWHVVRLRGAPSGDDGEIRWIDFELFTVVSETGSRPSFYANDSFEFNQGLTEDLDAAVPNVHGFVKGDSCTQVYFEDEPMHVDSEEQLAALFEAITKAQSEALRLMAETGGTW